MRTDALRELIALIRNMRSSRATSHYSHFFLELFSIVPAIALFWIGNCNGAETSYSPVVRPRTLIGREFAAACDARKTADLKWADLRNELEAQRPSTPGLLKFDNGNANSAILQERLRDVEQAYRDMINKYPQTEFEAYSAMRLSGVHQQCGHFDKAVQILEQTAARFEGSFEGHNLILSAGLVHAQATKDYTNATILLERIPLPTQPTDSTATNSVLLYLSAQEQLAKIELKLGHDQRAERRIISLKRALPSLSSEIDTFFQFELSSRNSNAADAIAPDSSPKQQPTSETLSQHKVRTRIWVVTQFLLLPFLLLFIWRISATRNP